MTSFRIFFNRLKNIWRFKYKNYRTVADWTIIVYLIIPAIVIGIFIYRSWWLNGVPPWAMMLPAQIYFLLGYLLSWSGNFRTFIEDGDRIFLVKHDNIFCRLKKWGFSYTLFLQMVKTVILIVFLLPFFYHQQLLEKTIIISFFMFIVGMNFFLMHFKYQLVKIENKWLQTFVAVSAFIILGILPVKLASPWLEGSWIVFALSIVMGLFGIIAHFQQLKKTYLFEHDLKIELEEKMSGVQMIYQLAPIEKTKVISKKKPWLFRNSKKIFKKRTAEKGFIELYLKVFLRNGEYVRTIIQITSITATAVVIIPPLWIKIVLFSVFLFMSYSWLEGAWMKIVSSHPFMKKYEQYNAYYRAKRNGIRPLFYLSIIFHLVIVSVGLWIYELISKLL